MKANAFFLSCRFCFFLVSFLNLTHAMARLQISSSIQATSVGGTLNSQRIVGYKEGDVDNGGKVDTTPSRTTLKPSNTTWKPTGPFSKPQRNKSSMMLTKETKHSKLGRFLVFDQVDYAQPKTHPPTKPPRK